MFNIQELSGHQIPYKSDKMIKSERNLFLQIRVSGVELDNQLIRTKIVKNNG